VAAGLSEALRSSLKRSWVWIRHGCAAKPPSLRPPAPAPQSRLDAAPDLGSRLRMQDACHADCITALLAAESTHGRMLISASRDGVVKAWK
jgi:hypothetical protein